MTPVRRTAITATPVTWLTPSISERVLARWRVWAGVVLCGYLLVRVVALTQAPTRWEPVVYLRWLDAPLPVVVLWGLWVVALFGSLVWVRPVESVRWLPVVGGLAILVLFGHRSSGGQILWFDILPALHVGALLAAGGRFDAVRSGWALRLASLMTVITYVLAGIAKLRLGGLDWVSDGALERNISFSATRFEVLGGTPSPFATLFADLGFLSVPLGISVIAIELGAPLALVNRRIARVWALAAWVMHVGIAATMFVIFHWPLLGAAFLPLLLIAERPEHDAVS